jgi:membrane-associated protein
MGYFLGQTPLANQLHKVLLVVIFVSVLPIFYQISKSYRARRNAAKP